MKSIQMVALAATVGLCAGGGAANALTTFDPLGPGNYANEVVDGYLFDELRIVNGPCNASSGKPCAALNDNEQTTMTNNGGGTFDLVSFWFELLGKGTDNVLYVSADGATPLEFDVATYGNNDGGQYVTVNLTGVSSVKFSTGDGGNVRIDDLSIVPLPATAALLLLGVSGMAFGGRKRKA